MKQNLTSIKLGKEIREFLTNMNHNRVFVKKQNGEPTSKKDNLTYNQNLNSIVKYFKINNDRYLELVNMEIKND